MKPPNSAACWSERRRLLRAAVALAGGLILPAGGALARTPAVRVAVLPLQHRPAREILAELQDLFGDAATLRGDGFRLLVRADAQTLAQIRSVVTELDRPARELLLTVRRSADAPGRESGAGVEFETGTEGTGGRGTITRRSTTRRADLTQQLRMREGAPATILIGETEVQGFRVIAGRLGVGVEPVFRDTARGFQIRPQLQPDGRVRVDINQLHEQPGGAYPGRIDRQAVTTSITLEPGQWHHLASIGQSATVEERSLASRRSTRDRDAMTLQIRVDPLD